MDLYFVRHGTAVERSEDLPDTTRPLTHEGLDRTRSLARLLKRMGIRWDVLLTSPLVRTVETAQLLVDAGIASEIVLYPPLAPGGDFQLFKAWLGEHPSGVVALVGHQPDLGAWLELLLVGESKGAIPLKKSGVARLEWQKTYGELRWLLPPKVLDFF